MRPGTGKCFAKRNGQKIACALFLLSTTGAMAAPPNLINLAPIVSFSGSNGSGPVSTLVQGLDGNFYGTTQFDGAYKGGTVFKMTPTGLLMTIYSFCAQSNCIDGQNPNAGLVLGTDGSFYGTTLHGGANTSELCGLPGHPEPCGTIFKITSGGVLTTLYSFCARKDCIDGKFPLAGLVQATDGNFYGTTYTGGDGAGCSLGGCGTVFKVTPTGSLTTLYSFCTQSLCPDGTLPSAGLVQASDGNFYGTTTAGGNPVVCNDSGCGTVFKITPGGFLTTLYKFCLQSNCIDGSDPEAALIQATDGNLYGTTEAGGAHAIGEGGYGTVFKITPGGMLTTLYSFCAQDNCVDGIAPVAALVQARNGNFYGTTAASGGANYGGTVFKITPGGTFTTLYSFCARNNCIDGEAPEAALVQATNGSFYGTTYEGGSGSACPLGCGTVFRFTLAGPSYFVETLPISGRAGTEVTILGNNLTAATEISFNGTPVTYKVVSSTEIRTTVPAGATTGFVTVYTSSGMLESNKEFRITP